MDFLVTGLDTFCPESRPFSGVSLKGKFKVHIFFFEESIILRLASLILSLRIFWVFLFLLSSREIKRSNSFSVYYGKISAKI